MIFHIGPESLYTYSREQHDEEQKKKQVWEIKQNINRNINRSVHRLFSEQV